MEKRKNRLIPLFAAHNLSEAYIAKGKLAAEGIPCAIFDENTYAANPFYSVAIGGIRVMVNEKEFEHAYEILKKEFDQDLELLPEYLREKELAEVRKWVKKDPDVMSDIALVREVVKPKYIDDNDIAAVIRDIKTPRRSFFSRLFDLFK